MSRVERSGDRVYDADEVKDRQAVGPRPERDRGSLLPPRYMLHKHDTGQALLCCALMFPHFPLC